jgi:phosphatidate phosphatase APP1
MVTKFTQTLVDGYFKFCIPLDHNNNYGWNDYEVSIIHESNTITTKESYILPIKVIGIISDIDDTFLVSYTLNPLKNYTIYCSEMRTQKSV